MPRPYVPSASCVLLQSFGAQVLLESLLYRLHELTRGDPSGPLLLPTTQSKIFSHYTILVDRLNDGSFQFLRPCDQFWSLIQLPTLYQPSRPSKYRCNWIGRCLISFLILPIMSRHSPMSGLCLI